MGAVGDVQPPHHLSGANRNPIKARDEGEGTVEIKVADQGKSTVEVTHDVTNDVADPVEIAVQVAGEGKVTAKVEGQVDVTGKVKGQGAVQSEAAGEDPGKVAGEDAGEVAAAGDVTRQVTSAGSGTVEGEQLIQELLVIRPRHRRHSGILHRPLARPADGSAGDIVARRQPVVRDRSIQSAA